MPRGRPGQTLSGMKKRVLAGLLWFYATWYAWSVLASFIGLPDLLGPVIGVGVGALFAIDPLGWIWGNRKVDPAQPDARGVAELA